MRGLLVDDDVVYLRLLQRTLERRGHPCITATNGAATLQAARTGSPLEGRRLEGPQREGPHFEFVLLDLRLAQESGLSLIKPLREALPDARIIVLTGYASIATAVEAIKRGADDYLAKPASMAAVLRAIRGERPDEAQIDLRAMTPLSRLEWEHIQQALVETGGNVSAAARLLGMHRRSLQRKLSKRPSQGIGNDTP